jgi:hypothetical protein
MLTATLTIFLFAAGFASGYGVREILSRRRRARERVRWQERQQLTI